MAILFFIFGFLNIFSVWEDSTRLTRSDDTKTDAVGVIAFYRRLLHYDCIVLLKQYRPALKAYTIEMPTGEFKYR
jgi:ADP-sugar pyrophosphatase/8-oxo-dGDP phosphatase